MFGGAKCMFEGGKMYVQRCENVCWKVRKYMFRGVKIDLEEYSRKNEILRKCDIPRKLNLTLKVDLDLEGFELDLDLEEFELDLDRYFGGGLGGKLYTTVIST